jgi:cation:H+ antiporter
MFWLNFQSYALWINLLIFAGAAGVVWLAGSRISVYADGISERTGLGQDFVGLVFLALATEMPEIGTTMTAAGSGNAQLAVGNLFGGIMMQTAILAVVDLFIGRRALTYFTPRSVLLLQGTMLALMLGLILAATTAGELFSFFGVGLWSVLLFAAYIGSLYLSHRYEGQERWQPDVPIEEMMASDDSEDDDEPDKPHEKYAGWSLTRLALFFAGGSLLILLAGVTLAQAGEALAEQIGLSQTFVGATLLAASTSLPELSTCIAAARLGNYSMAISNIFGSNGIMVALIFLADLFYREGPILGVVESASMFTVAMGVVVTCAYVVGMVERRNQTVLRMGLDSVAVLGLYAGSLVVLYFIS